MKVCFLENLNAEIRFNIQNMYKRRIEIILEQFQVKIGEAGSLPSKQQVTCEPACLKKLVGFQ